MTKTCKHNLNGFAVAFTGGRVEYWAHDPSFLTQKQRKILGISGFKSFTVAVPTEGKPSK